MPRAEQDRLEIFNYIADDNPEAAVRLDKRFGKAAANLADFPRAGHAGKVPGTLEIFPHESYRLVYEIEGDHVHILTLAHASRQWPPAHDIRASHRP